MSFEIDRRDFMKSAALFSAMGVAPQFLMSTVEGTTNSIEGFKDDHVLVVVQLGGGNDGLNTVVPHQDDAYYRARPTIGLKKEDLLRLTDELWLNNRVAGLKELYEDGALALIQGVGYPNPERSHFRSMEIWHTATDAKSFSGTGWVGRYFDNHCTAEARPQVGIVFDKERPQAFNGEKGYGLALDNPRNFGWNAGRGADSQENFDRLNKPTGTGEGPLDFLRHVTSNAIISAQEIREAAERGGKVKSKNRFQRKLNTVAALIRGGLDTRIYYVSVSGFDTHAKQRGKHDRLLEEVTGALAQFQKILHRDGLSERVLTMVFSEFGRRVNENKSGGTDHGTAAPMFLIGDCVKPGLHGQSPNLTDLDDGDLKHSIDFRNVYATVLDGWFNVDPATVLGRPFDTLGLIV